MKRILLGLTILLTYTCPAWAEPVFLKCELPNIIPSEFLIDVEKEKVLNSQEIVDPFDKSKTPSFKVLSIESDNITLVREYNGMRHRKRVKIKELIYINRYTLRATDRVWLDEKYSDGGGGSCKVIDKKL